MHKLIASLSLTFCATLASATTLQYIACTSPGGNVICDTVPNDAGEVIAFQRLVIPQVYLGNGVYQPAYSVITVTVDGTVYTTQPFAYSVTSVATGLQDWNETWSGNTVSEVGLPLSFNVQMHKHKKTCSGRACGTGFTYQLLGGTVN